MKKISIRTAIIFTCIFQNIHGFSQATTLNLPDLLPPSPDVSAITKGAELSSVMHTGAASASIPIYELKLKGFTLPISLNYNSNGYKPEEVPSRVGLGWNLEAGGVVSRIVQGKPDDDTHYPTPPTTIGINDDTWYWAKAISDPESEYDTRPDEYRFSVNGISGKFVYKRDGSILQIPYSNVKINAPLQNGIHIPDIITITDSKGVQYVFGANGEKEETLSHSMTTGYLNKQHIKTAWMLSKILLPNGGRIDFTYASVDVHKNNGYASGIKKHINPDNTYCTQAFNVLWFCPVSTETVPESHSSIHYNSYYLTSIKVEGIEEIHFEYEGRHDNNPNNDPDDNTGDNRLKEISVFNNQSSRTVKRVQLDYENWVTNSHGNSVYSLSHVKFLDPTNPNIDQQVYTLEYNEDIAPQPGIVNYTKGIDFLGFANASGISSDKHYLQDLSTDPDFKDNVNAMQPNGNIAQNRMLKKITYPTGGSETFFCEPNVASYWDNISPETFLKVSVEGIGNTPAAVYTHDFSTNVTQEAEIYASVTWTGPGLPPSQPGGEPEPKTAFVYVINTNDNSAQERTLFGYSTPLTGTPKVHLIAGAPYRLEIHVRDDYQNFGKAAVVYKNNIPSVWKEVKKELCGVRVHKIVSHDPVTGKDIPKYYTYRSLMDTTGQSSASAQKLYQPQYISIEYEASSCASHSVGQDPPNEGGLIVCKSKVFSTNSIATVEINQAAGVVYSYVLESDDSLFAHGCIEHKFDFYGQELGLPILNGDIPDKPLDMNDFRNGKELETVYYNNERKVLKRVTNSYSVDSRVNGGVEYNYIIRKRYNNSLEHHPVAEEDMECFDVNEYDIYTGWYHLDQTQTEEFDLLNNTVHSNTVTYTYDHTENIAPTSTSTTNSEGVVLRTELKYPNDFSTEEPYNKMVEKNILEPVIQQDNYKDSKHLYQTYTKWRDWNDQNILNANHYVLGPEILKKQKGDVPIEDRIHYYHYDKYANPLEVSKENDTRISYIWDY